MTTEIRMYAYVDGTFAKVVETVNSRDEIVNFDKLPLTVDEALELHRYLTEEVHLIPVTKAVMGKRTLYRTDYVETDEEASMTSLGFVGLLDLE